MSEPLEMNVDFETSDTEMNLEADMNCNVKVPLPIASATRLGGIKVGENLSIAPDGMLSAEASPVVVDDTLTIAGAAADAKKTGDEISGLKEDLSKSVAHITGNTRIKNYTNNKSIDTSGETVDITNMVDNVGFRNAIIDVSEGDKFTINGRGGSLPRLWCFIDSNGNVLSRADSGTSETNLLITAPAGASKLIVQNFMTDGGDSYYGELENLQVDILKKEVQKFSEIFGVTIVEGASDIQKNFYSNIVDVYIEGNPSTFKDMRIACARNTTSFPHEIILIKPNGDLVYGGYRDTGYNRFIQGSDTLYIKIDWSNYLDNFNIANYDKRHVQFTGVFAPSYNRLCQLYPDLENAREEFDTIEAEIDLFEGKFDTIEPKLDLFDYGYSYTDSITTFGYITNDVATGQTISTTPTASDSYRCLIIPVEAGETYKVVGTGASLARLWATADSEMKLIAKSAAFVSGEHLVEITQDGYLIYNTRSFPPYGIYLAKIKGFTNSTEKMLTSRKFEAWTDKPKKPYFILALDCAKKYISIANIKSFIDAAAVNGFNQLQIQLTTDTGFRFELTNNMTVYANGTSYDLTPCLGGVESSSSWYNINDMDEIIAYAKSKGVDVFPFIPMPCHMQRFLTVFPQFAASDASYCLDFENADAVNFSVAVLKKYARYFASRGCHFYDIGFDEVGAYGGFSGIYSSGRFGDLADYANTLIQAVKECGLKPRIYNEVVGYENNYDYQISRDSEVLMWKPSGGEFATPRALQSMGYDVINSSWTYYYIEGQGMTGTTVSYLQATNPLLNYTGITSDYTFSHVVHGAAMSIWCDNAAAVNPGDGGDALLEDVLPWIGYFGDAIKNAKAIYDIRY